MLYTIKLASGGRVLLPKRCCEIAGIEKTVYMELYIDKQGRRFLRVYGTPKETYELEMSFDSVKRRFIIKKEVREKLGITVGDELDVFVNYKDKEIFLSKKK